MPGMAAALAGTAAKGSAPMGLNLAAAAALAGIQAAEEMAKETDKVELTEPEGLAPVALVAAVMMSLVAAAAA